MSAPKHRKTNSSTQLKFILPSISRKPSVISFLDPKQRPSHRTSRSQHDLQPPQGDGLNISVFGTMTTGIMDPHGDVTEKLQVALKMLDLAMDYHKKKQYESIILIMEEMDAICLVYQAKAMVIGFYKTYATILLELSEYSKCIVVAKRLLSEGMHHRDYSALMCAYEKMGESFSKIKNFEESLRNYFMMLKVALIKKDYKKELIAYDKIGLQYFNLNQLDRGEYFHTKMLEGRIEPDGSNLRKLSIIPTTVKVGDSWQIAKQIEPEQQDLEELAMVFFEPMGVNPKYRELDDKKKKAYEYQDNLKNPVRRIGNVKVYGQSTEQIKIVRAGYTLKPTNCPLATLAHLSANRSIKVFDAISGADNKGFFRFLKFGKQFNTFNRRVVMDALTDFKLLVIECQKKVIRATENT